MNIDEIRLTDKEVEAIEIDGKLAIKRALDLGRISQEQVEAINLASIKKVVEWLDEHSWDGSLQHWGAPLPDGSYPSVQCIGAEDWAALKATVKEE